MKQLREAIPAVDSDFQRAIEIANKAIALYRAEGFDEVDAFNDEPNAHHWFAREL